jgi:hypothetical protein
MHEAGAECALRGSIGSICMPFQSPEIDAP